MFDLERISKLPRFSCNKELCQLVPIVRYDYHFNHNYHHVLKMINYLLWDRSVPSYQKRENHA